MKGMMILSVAFPILAGILLLVLPNRWMAPMLSNTEGHEHVNRKPVLIYTSIVMLLGALLAGYVIKKGDGTSLVFFKLAQGLELKFAIDGMSRIFAAVVVLIWILACVFSFEYMKHESHEKRYFGFFLITFGVLIGLDFSGNLMTLYLFYEMMTLVSMPLVLHNGSREAVMAGLKYLMYSFAGAYMALFGLFFLYQNCNTLDFLPGGSLNLENMAAMGQTNVVLLAAFLMILGYGVKAGMFPLHAWLPTAHPVAPAPASAVLSGVIVKGGVLALLRVIFYNVGADFIRGTWVQYTWIILAMITVFMGSMLALREQVFKKRLAYSTVSQLSYILLGMAVLNPTALTGSILHVVFHAIIKTALFLSAGALIYQTGNIHVNDYKGIGKRMPLILWSYTFASLSLIGIPPFSGFVGKWYLAIGALDAEGIGKLRYIAPAVLLLSALLTAAYLLPITIKGFLPGNDFDYEALAKEKQENKKALREPICMAVPLLVLALLTLALGLFPNPLIHMIESAISSLF